MDNFLRISRTVNSTNHSHGVQKILLNEKMNYCKNTVIHFETHHRLKNIRKLLSKMLHDKISLKPNMQYK